MIFDTHVNGIPCQCSVIHFKPGVPVRYPSKNHEALDPPEYPEFEYRLLDSKGYLAPWLERYITPEVDDKLLVEYQIMREAHAFGY